MGVTTRGFAYPESTDHVRLWEHIQALAEDVDGYLAASIEHAVSSYTPVWASAGTAPNIGNGTRVGQYRVDAAGMVDIWGKITFGTTSTFGTSTYNFTLPVTADSAVPATGTAYLRDSSAASVGHFPGVVVIDPTISTSTFFIVNVNAVVGQTVPFTWDDPDSISFYLRYLAA